MSIKSTVHSQSNRKNVLEWSFGTSYPSTFLWHPLFSKYTGIHKLHLQDATPWWADSVFSIPTFPRRNSSVLSYIKLGIAAVYQPWNVNKHRLLVYSNVNENEICEKGLSCVLWSSSNSALCSPHIVHCAHLTVAKLQETSHCQRTSGL